jgi:RNA polymerase sigma-70 factor (ECF subfamily)
MSVTPPLMGASRAPPETPASDGLAALLRRVAAGEECALELLYDLTAARLFSLASFIVRNSQDAEEVVCDAFVQIWRNAWQYDPQRGSALAWLLTICRSRALDRYRRNRAALAPRLGDPALTLASGCEPGPDDILQLFERDSAVFGVLAMLSPVRRRLVALAFFQGLTHEEIARETALPVGTVKSHIRRALAVMRSQLGARQSSAQPE